MTGWCIYVIHSRNFFILFLKLIFFQRVEYTDTLGRSRTCLRKDLPYYQKLNEDLTPKEEPEEKLKEADFAKQSEELQLWYKKRDELREKWEEEEKVLSTKRDIHYRDVLFGGIYFTFVRILSIRFSYYNFISCYRGSYTWCRFL